MPKKLLLLAAIAACTAFAAASTAIAAVGVQAVPVTTISLFPASPDGSNGWWVTPPEVRVMSDTAGNMHYILGAEDPVTRPVSAGVAYYVGDAPHGTATIRANTVAGASVGATTSVTTRVDALPPTIPGNARLVVRGSTNRLTWTSSVETGSGVDRYNIYRNLTGPPFQLTDQIAQVSGTSYTDLYPPGFDAVYYAVSAMDRAGWESIFTAGLVADITPPSPPSDVQAWFNTYGWCRVSWAPSTDLESNLARYVIYRSDDGGPWYELASVGAAARYYDDFAFDPDAGPPGTVDYKMIAVDRAFLESTEAGPARMGSDLTAPSSPSRLVVAPVWSGRYVAAEFDVSWSPGSDSGSGVLQTQVLYGTDEALPDHEHWSPLDETELRVTAASPTALLYFSARCEDRAGNISGPTIPVAARNVAADRVAGADRIATSLAISRVAFATSTNVVIASARSYPDALCGSSLAGVLGAPIILVGDGPLPASTLAELRRLKAVNAYIIGGTAAVSQETRAFIDDAMTGNVVRVAGPTRYETAVEVAKRVRALQGGVVAPRAFIVSGVNFADALSVGPVACAQRNPVLYATDTSVPASTLDIIDSMGITSTVVVGGDRAVTPLAESLLPGCTRVSGPDRYATSRAFAAWAVTRTFVGYTSPVLVTGLQFPDGLSAAPLASLRASVILLTSPTSYKTSAAWLGARRVGMLRQTTIGGTGAVAETQRREFWEQASIP